MKIHLFGLERREKKYLKSPHLPKIVESLFVSQFTWNTCIYFIGLNIQNEYLVVGVLDGEVSDTQDDFV